MRCELHGDGDVTAGSEVTRTAGCQGGGEGGSGGCGGTGQPASATGTVVVDVVVDAFWCAEGWDGLPDGRVVTVGCACREAAETER